MKTLNSALAPAGLLALAACGGNADDKAAENISDMTGNKTPALEARADNMGGANDDARLENQVANQINQM